jgi:hypothetical protein
MTQHPVITRGTTFTISTGTIELKSIIVGDPTMTVGEAAALTITAHDGSTYSTSGEVSEHGFSIELLQDVDTFSSIMTTAYGAPTVVGSTSTWDLDSPTQTAVNIAITPPATNGKTIGWKAVNASALSIVPALPSGDFGRMTLNMTLDYWQALLTQ